MMRYELLIPILLITFLPIGCAPKERPAIRIDDVVISRDEFLESYKKSPLSFHQKEIPQAFLDQFIAKKIILRQAEQRGLDREHRFLAELQNYWEQELLKLMLAEKNRELSDDVIVSPGEIKAYFEQNKDKFPPEKTFDEVLPEIQAFLTREKQKAALEMWVEGLKEKARIEIDPSQISTVP